ncbi:MAG: hypothetical protein CMK92_04490 [Pseudomonas sp.]|nr:hypothetical protein [Pseudomonas sp.]
MGASDDENFITIEEIERNKRIVFYFKILVAAVFVFLLVYCAMTVVYSSNSGTDAGTADSLFMANRRLCGFWEGSPSFLEQAGMNKLILRLNPESHSILGGSRGTYYLLATSSEGGAVILNSVGTYSVDASIVRDRPSITFVPDDPNTMPETVFPTNVEIELDSGLGVLSAFTYGDNNGDGVEEPGERIMWGHFYKSVELNDICAVNEGDPV